MQRLTQSSINRWSLGTLLTYSSVFCQISLRFARLHCEKQSLVFTEIFHASSNLLQLWLRQNWLFGINPFSILDTASLKIIWDATFLTSLYITTDFFPVWNGAVYKCHFKMHNLTASHGAGSHSLVWRKCDSGHTPSLLCVDAKSNHITFDKPAVYFWHLADG